MKGGRNRGGKGIWLRDGVQKPAPRGDHRLVTSVLLLPLGSGGFQCWARLGLPCAPECGGEESRLSGQAPGSAPSLVAVPVPGGNNGGLLRCAELITVSSRELSCSTCSEHSLALTRAPHATVAVSTGENAQGLLSRFLLELSALATPVWAIRNKTEQLTFASVFRAGVTLPLGPERVM